MIDAKRLIASDLEALRRERAQHFRGALLLLALGSAAALTIVGKRPDLLAQPLAQLGAQTLNWALGLAVLPALGLGLWFPSAGTRRALAGLTIVAVGLVAAGPTLWSSSAATGPPTHGLSLARCVLLAFGTGTLALIVGATSGAFGVQRRPTATLWLATAVASIAIGAVAWHCPRTDTAHTLPSHAGSGLALALVAAGVGRIGRRSAAGARPR